MTFPRVNEVQPGDRLTSANVAQLADALNARIRSGLGDAAFRLAFWWFGAFRQLRNPDASRSLWPSNAEFFEAYQSLGPGTDFPDADPGDAEGLNQASLLPWYVYGSDATGRYDEAARLTDPELGGLPMEECATLREAWELGKRQRGALVPTTGQINAPAFSAARDVFAFVHGGISQHGKSYGGFLPMPEYLGDCAPPGGSQAPAQSFAIRFTNTKTGATVTYPGTCPDDPTNVSTVLDFPLEYYVIKFSGAVDWYPKSIWIQGPYNGGTRVSKTEGEHLPRIANRFAGEFRGSVDQVAAEYSGAAPYLGQAFDVRRFLALPYYLAPARALTASADYLTPVYQTGGAIKANDGDTIGHHVSEPSFWFAAAFIRGPAGGTVGAFDSSGAGIGQATCNDAGEAICTFTAGASDVTLRVISGSGAYSYELAELLQYRAQTHDLFTVLRIAGARLTDAQGTDGCGLVEDRAADLWAAYSSTGCIPKVWQDNELPGPLTTINHNAVFDAARRYSRAVRVVRRQEVVGYALENGKSVVWVDPHPFGMQSADTLAGIRDAIAHNAPPNGWSNEWVGFWQFKGYNPSGSSIWKPESYSDFFAMSDRCVFGADPFTVGLDLKLHFNSAYPSQSDLMLAPEVAPGWRYATNGTHAINTSASEEFYRSCQVYPAPYEIETAETVREGGRELVKITFTGRFQHGALAPSSISRDVSTWDMASLLAERQAYATDENALRDYLAHVADGSRQCDATGAGNAAVTYSPDPDAPFGACYPHLWLVQLVPKPYADGNDAQNDTDTPVTHAEFSAMETYIRVMCEGCVDGQTSSSIACATGVATVFDFTFPTLCYRAFGRTSFGTLPTATTDYLDETEVRTDTPIGYGPLPTVRMAAETFNQYARAVNLMTRYRLMMPMGFETETSSDTGPKYAVTAQYPDGSAVDCAAIGSNGFLATFTPQDHTPTTVTAPRAPAVSASGQKSAAFASVPTYSDPANCFGSRMGAQTSALSDEYWYQPTDANAHLAIPEAWRSLALDDSEMLARVDTTTRKVTITRVPAGTACVGTHWTAGADQLQISVTDTTVETCDVRPNHGRVVADPLPSVTVFGATNGGLQCDGEIYSSFSQGVAITPLQVDAIIVSVPLTDPTAES